jgi:hypothetical protein
MTNSEQIEYVARAIWLQRRIFAAKRGIMLEEWGDGSVPRANGILDEARAAIDAVAEVDPTI